MNRNVSRTRKIIIKTIAVGLLNYGIAQDYISIEFSIEKIKFKFR